MNAVSTSKPTLWLRPWPIITVLGVAAAAVLYAFDPNHSTFYPGCVFYRTTGLLCPGCGGLRGMHQLLHGHIVAAWHCNALLLLTMAVVGALGAWNLIRSAAPAAGKRPVTDLALRPLWVTTYLSIAVVFWVVRNLPGPGFAWLRP